ncbi:MAG TPA: hypothetical protein VFZ73_12010 [Gemmatimonadaceae bacterium]
MGERESRETGATARSVNVVHYIERDIDAAAALLAGVVERGMTSANATPSCLVLLPTADDALAFCEALVARRRDAERQLVPVTSIQRGARLLSTGPFGIAASPEHVAALISQSRLELAQLHTLLMVWPEDALVDDERRRVLEHVIAEVPRGAERVAVCSTQSEELGRFLERTMWRAREVNHRAPGTPVAVTLRVLTAHPSERIRAIRSVLDALDPPSATLLTFNDETEAAARHASSVLGALVQVTRGIPEQRTNLAILFDDVPDAGTLTAAAAIADELVAIVRPTRLRALQEIAPSAVPLTWTGALASARSAHDALRDEIRGYAGSGAHQPWVPIVEPLLEGLDAVDVAASALALLDRERRKAKRAPAVTAAAPEPERVRREEARPRPRRGDDRAGRSDRESRGARDGGPKRPWAGRSRDARDRDARDERAPRQQGARGRPDDIERTPRAAREGREWSERGERLRHSRRGPRRGESA